MSEPIQSIAQNNYILQAPTPTATMFTTELEYDGDKISGYAGSAFKAGDEFPISADEAVQYVQTNSAGIDDTVTNVQTNSGVWGGSALPISAGPGIKVNLVDNTLVFSNDETVLYSGAGTTAATLSEPITNFERFKIKVSTNEYFEFPGIDGSHTIQFGNGNSSYLYFKMVNFNTNNTSLTTNQNLILNYGKWNAESPNGFYYDRTSEPNWLNEVIGINRKK